MFGISCTEAQPALFDTVAAIRSSAYVQPALAGVRWGRGSYDEPNDSQRTDLRALAGMVTDHRDDLPARACRRPCSATWRLFLFRESASDFCEADRALLTLLRPHLHQAYLDAERRRQPGAVLTSRQRQLLELVAAGYTNAQIARRLDIAEGTVRKHLENIYRRL